ncbi:hypothetical protein [Neobacillus cucumis]|uniref:zinc-ribbon domain-containing protein n=1 Tax=Neobacillus cucumis TaxID=1740721 RepID=UPI002E1EAB36|nr:hypothetical protein [Neobacillus cucumis]
MGKVTHEDFVERVHNSFGETYSVESEYRGVRNKVKIKHTICGYTHDYYPNNFLMSNGRCLKCEGGLRYTPDLFLEKIFALVGDEYTVLDEYKNYSDKLRFEHKVCGNIHPFRPSDFISGGSRCPKCQNKKRAHAMRKSPQQFHKEFEQVSQGEYLLLDEYFNVQTHVNVKHLKCNREYPVYPGNFLRGAKCNYCNLQERVKTTEQFKQEVFDLWQDEYVVLGEYIRSDEKVKMFHQSCGQDFNVRPANFLCGTECTHCFRKVKKTTEQFIKEVQEVWGSEYTVLGEYRNNNTHIAVRHNVCGYEYPSNPQHLLKQHGCAKCSGNLPKTTEEFIQEVHTLVGVEYSVLGYYTSSKDHILMKHHECGHEYPVTPNHFLNGRRCPNCFGPYIRTEEEFREEFYELVQDEYCILGEYKGYDQKILLKHNTCGHQWDKRISDLIRGQRCPKCYGNIRKTTESFKQEVFEKVGNEYIVLGEYVNTNTKIKMQHNTCGYKYPVTPDSFLHGTRCPKCNESKGERKISDFLSERGIPFQMQYRFPECRHINPLPFDFAVLDNNQIVFLIEYDGQLHFMPRRDDDESLTKLKLVQLRDSIKTNFCEEHNIPLVRIPYTEFEEIEAIVDINLNRYFKSENWSFNKSIKTKGLSIKTAVVSRFIKNGK